MAIIKRVLANCQHNKFIVDESLECVECGLCGARLNPMWVLAQLSHIEARLKVELKALQSLVKKTENKLRCKCEHCGKITSIVRPK